VTREYRKTREEVENGIGLYLIIEMVSHLASSPDVIARFPLGPQSVLKPINEQVVGEPRPGRYADLRLTPFDEKEQP